MLGDLSGKFVELVIQLEEPKPTINYLWYTEWADGQYRLQVTERTGQSNGVKFRPRGISDIAEATNVMAAMKAEGAVTVIIQSSPFTYRHRAQLINDAMNYGVATISGFSTAARDGALIAYGQTTLTCSVGLPPTLSEFSRVQTRLTSRSSSRPNSSSSSTSRRLKRLVSRSRSRCCCARTK
jgi:hypothetical protein